MTKTHFYTILAITCYIVSCDRLKCILTWFTNTLKLITTYYIANCNIKLCKSVYPYHFSPIITAPMIVLLPLWVRTSFTTWIISVVHESFSILTNSKVTWPLAMNYNAQVVVLNCSCTCLSLDISYPYQNKLHYSTYLVGNWLSKLLQLVAVEIFGLKL